MLKFFRDRAVDRHEKRAAQYLEAVYRPPVSVWEADDGGEGDVRYSVRSDPDLFGRLEKRMGEIRPKTFSGMVRLYIREKGYANTGVYRAAQIDRKLFSKIVSNDLYRPSRDTAIALAFALRLTNEEADELMRLAGYGLSRDNKRDVVIEYCLENRFYDLIGVNELLYRFDLEPIGG